MESDESGYHEGFLKIQTTREFSNKLTIGIGLIENFKNFEDCIKLNSFLQPGRKIKFNISAVGSGEARSY